MNSHDTLFPIQAPLCFWVEYMVQRGFDPADVLMQTGLDSKTYALPGKVLSDRQELAVYANSLRLTGSGAVGLDAGARVNINGGGTLGALVANAVDVGHAGYLLRRFYHLSSRWFMPELIGALSPGKTIVRYRQTADLGQLYRLMIDCNIRGTQQVLVEAFGPAARAFVSEVAFGYAAPRDAQRYSDEFSCPVSFGHEFTFVTYDDEVGRLINTKRNELAYRVFLQHCREMASRFAPSSWKEKTLNILACIDHYPSADAMAKKLNCSKRSLGRHLQDEGVQYSELVDKVKFDRATYMLRHSNDSVKTIGYQLSYSEPAAFIRAFARWSGLTPTEFRRTTPVTQ